MLTTVVTILFVVCCLMLTLLIMLQSSKGGLGAGLGGGTQSTQVFGGQGAGSFLSKWTVRLAILFMLLSLGLARLSSAPQSILGTLEDMETTTSEEDEVIEEGTLDPGAAGAQPVVPTPVDAPPIEPPAAQEIPAEEIPAQDAAPAEAPTEEAPAAQDETAPAAP